MKMKIRVVVPVACLAIALFCGCQKKEESAPSVKQAQTENSQVFSASLPPALTGKTIGSGGKSNIEIINNNRIDQVADVKSEDGFELSGWALDDRTKSAPEIVFIELAPVKGGARYYATAGRSDRDDVVKAFNEQEYKKAGYVVKADIKSVPPGEYEINIIQVVDGNPILTLSGKKINKKN